MSRITITIEDSPDGKVKTVCTPSVETMLKKNASGNVLTSAEGYAIFMLNKLREESKRPRSNIIVPIPRLGRS